MIIITLIMFLTLFSNQLFARDDFVWPNNAEIASLLIREGWADAIKTALEKQRLTAAEAIGLQEMQLPALIGQKQNI